MPLHLALLIDSSDSMQGRMDAVRQSSHAFLERMMNERDRVALLTFANSTKILLPFTTDRESLANAIEAVWAHGGTAFRDSVVATLHFLVGLEGRRALVVLTDGIDQHSELSLPQTLEYAQRAGVAVYTIGLGVRQIGHATTEEIRASSKAEHLLRSLSEESGGRAFILNGVDTLAWALRRIEEDLRSRYLLTFQSQQQDDSFRRIEVKVNRSGLSVRTAAGYYP